MNIDKVNMQYLKWLSDYEEAEKRIKKVERKIDKAEKSLKYNKEILEKQNKKIKNLLTKKYDIVERAKLLNMENSYLILTIENINGLIDYYRPHREEYSKLYKELKRKKRVIEAVMKAKGVK